jgi:glycerophosphoryl diester phosphodiesterase
MTVRRTALASLLLAMTAIVPIAMPEEATAQARAPMHSELARLRDRAYDHKAPIETEVAHRGIFHGFDGERKKNDVVVTKKSPSVPENSLEALDRASRYGFKVVEIDVRLSKSGTPWVIHDYILDRTVSGILKAENKKQIEFNILKAWANRGNRLHPTWISEKNDHELVGKKLKAYTSTQIKKAPDYGMEITGEFLTLKQFLEKSKNRANVPLIILDLQDPQTTSAAAKAVKEVGMQDRVVLKFFANRAVESIFTGFEATDYLDGPRQTIENWGNDLWYIIQFNNNEFNWDDNHSPLIYKYTSKNGVSKREWTIKEYIDAFIATKRVIGIGLSMPLSVLNQDTDLQKKAAEQVAREEKAVVYIRNTYQQRGLRMPLFGVIVNPDVAVAKTFGPSRDRQCLHYSFSGKPGSITRTYAKTKTTKTFPAVSLNLYEVEAHRRRQAFAKSLDYFIEDAMPNGDSRTTTSDPYIIRDRLCGKFTR